uniref:Uncharacterized protein n=1 Tax=Fagus sylvatica TaxID=28930 RepID=A0A2N9HKY0_FAGSY
MRDFLQGVSFSLWSDSGTPKLLIPLANLVDLQLRGSRIDWSALVWAQWVSRELMISLNLKRARKIWEKERERLIRRGPGSFPPTAATTTTTVNQPRATKTHRDHHRESTVNHHKPNKNPNPPAQRPKPTSGQPRQRPKPSANPPPQADLGSANPTTTPSHRFNHPRPRQRPKPTESTIPGLGKDPNPPNQPPQASAKTQTHQGKDPNPLNQQTQCKPTTPGRSRQRKPNNHPKPPIQPPQATTESTSFVGREIGTQITRKREAQPPNQPVLPSTTTTPASPSHHRINQFRASTESRKSKERRESRKQMRRREKFSEEMRRERKKSEEIACEMVGSGLKKLIF